MSKRGRKKKDRDREERSSKSSRHQQQPEEEPTNETPSVEEVCEQLELNDVDIEFTENHYQNLVTYKMFTQFVRPTLQKENPKAQTSKIMMLTAAKWREFCEENPNLREEEPEAEAEAEAEKSEEEEEEEPELEYQPKPSRSRRQAEKQEEPEESDEDDGKRKKRGNVRAGKKGRKQKVPTLKIKFGKKKDQSSDEEKVKLSKVSSRAVCLFLFSFRKAMQ